MISIEDLVRYRRRTEALVERVAETALPDRVRRLHGVRLPRSPSTAPSTSRSSTATSADGEPVLTRVHSECLTGDVFGSQRCDCGPQLDEALERIVDGGPRRRRLPARPRGPRHRAGRTSCRPTQLQDGGRDTVDANLDLGLPADARDYGAGAQILRDLGVAQRAAADQQPGQDARASRSFGVPVAERVPLTTPAATTHNLRLPADQAGPDGPRPAPSLGAAADVGGGLT